MFKIKERTIEMDDENFLDGLEWVLAYSRKLEKLAQTILMCSTDFLPCKKDEAGNSISLAYTFYSDKRMQIALDFDRLTNVESVDIFMFFVYHELMHNLLQHFTRPKIAEYTKKNPKLVNVIIDFYANEAALEMSGTKKKQIDDNIAEVMYSTLEEKQEFFKNGGGIVDEQKILDLAKKFEITMPKPLNEMVEEKVLELFFESEKMKEAEAAGSELAAAIEQLGENSSFDDHGEFEKALAEAAEKAGMDVDSLKDLIQAKLESELSEASKTASGAGTGGNILERHLKRNRKKINILNTFKIKNVIGRRLIVKTKRTYSNPYRKQDQEMADIVRKGKQRLKGNKLIVAIDVSGSVSEVELMKIYNICLGYLDKGGELQVVFWSSCEIIPERDVITSVMKFEELEKHKVHSSGGTQVEYLYKYLNETFTKTKVNFVNISDFEFWNFPELPACIEKAYHLAICPSGEQLSRKHYPMSETFLVKEFNED